MKKKVTEENDSNEMQDQEKNVGVGCLRGAVLALPLLVILPIAVWYEYKFLYGLLSFLGGVAVLVYLVNSAKKLTAIDVALPVVISLISAIIFAPVGLFAGNFFSPITCILAGLMLSVELGFYKAKKIYAVYLILPTICFIYEILPIDLPTDIDNIIGLCANGANIFRSHFIQPVIGATGIGTGITTTPKNKIENL
jgi:hypothetical protein